MVNILVTPRDILCSPRQGMGEKHLVTNAVAWHPVSHVRAAQRAETTKCDLTDYVKGTVVN